MKMCDEDVRDMKVLFKSLETYIDTIFTRLIPTIRQGERF